MSANQHRDLPPIPSTARFTDDRLLPLVTFTALHRVTDMTREDFGWLATTIRPASWLSTGEQVLWNLLEALADGRDPSGPLDDLPRLDVGNQSVVLAVLDTLGMEVAS